MPPWAAAIAAAWQVAECVLGVLRVVGRLAPRHSPPVVQDWPELRELAVTQPPAPERVDPDASPSDEIDLIDPLPPTPPPPVLRAHRPPRSVVLHEIPADDLRDMAIQMLRLGHSSAQVEQDLMAFVARSMLDEETRWDETTAGPALKVERRLMQLAIRAIVRSCARRLGK